MTTYHPRNNQVLILPDGGATKNRGLIIPEAYVKIPSVGTVVDTGPGYVLEDGTRAKLDLEEGMRVDFVLHAGTQQREIDGILHFLMLDTDILAVITDEPPVPIEMPGTDEHSEALGADEHSVPTPTVGNGENRIVTLS